jgi:hypothetical protein
MSNWWLQVIPLCAASQINPARVASGEAVNFILLIITLRTSDALSRLTTGSAFIIYGIHVANGSL